MSSDIEVKFKRFSDRAGAQIVKALNLLNEIQAKAPAYTEKFGHVFQAVNALEIQHNLLKVNKVDEEQLIEMKTVLDEVKSINQKMMDVKVAISKQ